MAIATKYLIRKKIHAALYQGQYYDNVILIGSGSAAKNFFETVSKYYYYGYKCIGYVDNQNNGLPECNYLGGIENLENILLNNTVDASCFISSFKSFCKRNEEYQKFIFLISN